MLLRIARVLLFVGAATTLGFMAYAGEPTRASWWLFSLPFAAWTLLPYTLVGSEARRHPSDQGSLSLLSLSAALAVTILAARRKRKTVREADQAAAEGSPRGRLQSDGSLWKWVQKKGENHDAEVH